MIKYMGRAVSWVQYMPAKPIKHGIKVFVLCCAVSAVWLGYKIYLGKEDGVDGSALTIVDQLITDADLTKHRGRTLYTDNWYTSMKLAKHLFEKYGWTLVGTISPTDKKSRQDLDVPFLKLSEGARNKVERGWYREAVIKMKTSTGKTYYIQCTTWRDRKQVMFISSNRVGATDGLYVFRRSKGTSAADKIRGPMAQQDYVENFNAVDKNDRDSSDWSTSIQSHKYYLRIFCWGLDRVVHTSFVVVHCCAGNDIGPEEWKKYLDKNDGRHDFQIDLGIALMNYAIEMEWKDMDKRPDFMRQVDFIPCDCKQCFFCLNGHTNGIYHRPDKKMAVHYANDVCVRTGGGCTDVRVNLEKYKNGGTYCRMCYRKQSTGMSWEARRKLCKSSTMGCASCKEPICKSCWKDGYDRHKEE